MFDDLLEHASSSAVNYQEYFLHPMIKCITDKSAPVRQVSDSGQSSLTSVYEYMSDTYVCLFELCRQPPMVLVSWHNTVLKTSIKCV